MPRHGYSRGRGFYIAGVCFIGIDKSRNKRIIVNSQGSVDTASVYRSTAGSRHRNRVLIMGARRSRKSSGFILVSAEGPFSVLDDRSTTPRIVPLRRVTKVLVGESSHLWNERSARHDDDAVSAEGDGQSEAAHRDDLFETVRASVQADREYDPHDEFLASIGGLSRGRR